MVPKISLMICTYNPNEIGFASCLNAVDAAQKAAPFASQVIIIDNNSAPALDTLEYVRKFLAGGPGRSLLREPKPGKTNALLKGFQAATSDVILTVDDDNILSPDYLLPFEPSVCSGDTTRSKGRLCNAQPVSFARLNVPRRCRAAKRSQAE